MKDHNKKIIAVVLVMSVFSTIIGYFLFKWNEDDVDEFDYNEARINYEISVNSTHNDNYTLYLPVFLDKNNSFSYINDDIEINGENVTYSRIDSIHGPAFNIEAKGNFTMTLNKTYYDVLIRENMSEGYDFTTFWDLSLFQKHSGIVFVKGNFWIYYDNNNSGDSLSLSLYEKSWFFYGYSIHGHSVEFTFDLESEGWTSVPVAKTVFMT